MDWFGSVRSPEQSRTSPSRSERPQASVESVESLCESQQRCVKASIVTHWQLVEAQDRLGGLELHGCESAEQAHARAHASSTHLSQAEQEWRLKESLLGAGPDTCGGLELATETGGVGFDRSIISGSRVSEADSDKSLPFVQMHEQHLKHFGLLHRWDDSQRFLAQNPHIIREETANYLILWCFRLYAENKEALMEQVAHQVVVMQFILEMARSMQQDPRGCFRHFFQKAKAGQEGYLDVFHMELEAFKQRVREYAVKSTRDHPKGPEQQAMPPSCRLDPREVLESLPPELKACIQSQDMHILQNVLSTMNPQVAEYHIKRCLDAGLCVPPGRGLKEDDWDPDESRLMETS
ncbi:hsp90 co-chaperone Cdc37-like 1 [Brachyhypopomus gauderio]|uniref:hsp90 co-chaperone Cdc37-like 1 n=1 Tax=Brachyhypopomus gauderio TaxID=698409 RepID=UPI0040413019